MSMARRDAKCRSASRRCALQTQTARAAGDRLVFRARRRASRTPGNARGSVTTRASAGRRSTITSHDLRDHVARPAHDDRIADAHVLARELVHVVQRGVADRHAADEHRLEPRHRRQRAGATDLELDVAHHVVSSCAGNLCATAQRGARGDEPELALPVEPDRPCRPRRRSRTASAARRAPDARVVVERSRRRRPTSATSGHWCAGPSRAAAPAPRCGAPAASSPRPRPRRSRTGRAGAMAVTRGSSCRRLPAAALRGLAKIFSPRSACAPVQLLEDRRGMNTSPRTSSSGGSPAPRSASGTARMVRTLAVTSSPRRAVAAGCGLHQPARRRSAG